MNIKWNQVSVAFLTGLLIGTLLGASRLRRNFTSHWKKEPRHERMLRHFSSKLDLDAEQKTRVAGVLETKRTKIDALLAEMRPKFDKIRQETKTEISGFLNDDQRKKYEELDAKMEQRFKRKFLHHP